MTFQHVAVIGEPQVADSVADALRNHPDRVRVSKGAWDELRGADIRSVDLWIDTYEGERRAFVERVREAERHLPEQAVIAAYHPEISTTEMSRQLKHPQRFVGLHFFRPGKLTKLVEVVTPERRGDPSLAAAIIRFLKEAGFVPVPVKDRPGLLAYRLLVPYLNQAAQAFDDGIATGVDIDNSVVLGLGYPIGPLRLLDQMGIDRFIARAEAIAAELPERKYAVPPILKRMKSAGCLGVESGEGFYEYGK